MELTQNAAEYFDKFSSQKSSTLDRAENCAKVTIPSLFMEDGSSSQDDLKVGYAQGFGATLVKHLVGKFAMSILPANQSFYRLSAGNKAMEELTQGDAKARQAVEHILVQVEDGIMRYINNTNFRTSLYPALRLACVTGESIVEKLDGQNKYKVHNSGNYKVHNLRNYVVKRDFAGNVLHLLFKEKLVFDTVPEEIQGFLDDKEEDETIDLYTHIYMNEGKYNFYQEVEGNKFKEGTLKELTDRFIFVRWNVIDGEDYARGMVEDYYESFVNLEKQMKVLVENAVVAGKTVFTVNPNGMTRLKDYVGARHGDVIIGNETDIGTVKTNKHVDLQLTYNLVQDIKKELSTSFLLSGSSIRDAERVTAQEVQLIATENESAFGGIYTSIASDIQMPLVRNAIKELKIEGMDGIDIIITSGIEALGRNVEQMKTARLVQDLSMLAQLVGQESIVSTINVEAMVNSMVINSGVGNKGFTYSIAEQEANAKAKAQESMAQQAMNPALAQAGQNYANQMVPPQAQEGTM
jgi:hypothetical protein